MKGNVVRRTFGITVARGAGEATPEIVISSESVDRQGDVVVAAGGDWHGWFQCGAPVLWAHKPDQLPVAKGLRLWIDGQARTHATFRWVEGDDFAQRVKNIFAQNLLSASIGFRPIEQQPLAKTGGLRFTKWEGIEFSLTPCPANVDAVPVARALGLPTDNEIVLELDEPQEEVLDVTGFTPAELARWGRHRRQIDPYEPVREPRPEDYARAVQAAISRLKGRVD